MTALLRAYLLEFHAAPESLLECLGWTVVHSLWQGVVWAAVLAVILVVPARRGAEIRHQWALGTMLGFLAGVSLTFVSLLPRADGVLQESRPGLPAAASPASAPALAPMESPGSAVTATDPGTRAAGVSIPERSASRWQEWVAWGWISVVGSLLVWRVFGWVGIVRIRRQSSPASGVLPARFDLLSKKLGIRRRIPLVIHDRLRGVFLCGVFRPFVVVPAALANGMPLSEMEALLTHELVHWKRRDPWLKMAQTICELLLCHHPATWWMSRQINLTREMAADDLAVVHLGHREIYARALVHAAEWNASLSPALGATGTGLPARLARLAHPSPAPTTTPGMGMLAMVVGTLMLLVLLERPAVGQESASRIKPGESIQAAIDAAPAGGTLILAAGDFTERITISKPLTLRGEGWDRTRLKPADAGAPTLRVINASDVTLEHFSLGAIAPEEDPDGIGDTAMLEISASRKVKVSHMAATGPGWSGVEILASEEVSLTDSLCCGLWGTGVVVIDTEDKKCRKIRIEKCVLRHCHYAGMVLRATDVVVNRCKISGASWHGIRYDHCAPTLTDNEIFFNYRSGIYASGKTKATVTGNLICDNNFNAVSCWASNEDTYEGNTFAGNQRESIAVLDASKPVFRRNLVALSRVGIMLGQSNESGGGPATLPVMEDNYFWNITTPMIPPGKTDEIPAAVKPQDQPPGFVDAKGRLYFLTVDSPLRARRIGASATGPLPDPFPIQQFEKKIQRIRIDEDARERSQGAAMAGRTTSAGGFNFNAVTQDALQLESREKRQAAIEKIRAALGASDIDDKRLGLQAFMQILPVEFDKKSFRPLILPLLDADNAMDLRQACYALHACGAEPGDLDRILRIAESPPAGMRESLSHLLFIFSNADLTGKAGEAVVQLLNDGGATREILRGIWGAQFSPELEEKVIALSRNADGTTNHDAIYFALSPQANKSEKSVRRLIEVLADPDVVNNAGRAAWGLKQGVSKENYDLVANAALNVLEARSDEYLRRNALDLLKTYAGEKQIPAAKELLNKPNLDSATRQALENLVNR